MRALCWLQREWCLLLRTVLVRDRFRGDSGELCCSSRMAKWSVGCRVGALEVQVRAGALGVVGGKPWYQMTGRQRLEVKRAV